jgi:hypothetical protein
MVQKPGKRQYQTIYGRVNHRNWRSCRIFRCFEHMESLQNGSWFLWELSTVIWYKTVLTGPLNDILFYIAYLSHTNHSPSTVVTYISGLSHFHKLHNFPDNTQVFMVEKMIEGLKRKRPSKADVRVPISLDLLKRLITSLRSICTSTYEAALFSFAFSLAFFALLRIREIMSDTNNRPGTLVIRFLDIMFKVSDCGNEQLHLTLKSSKTDQRLKSVTLIIRRQVDKLICPIESLKRYLSIRSNFPDGNLFIHFDGSNLTRYQFSYILQKSLNFCEEKGLYKPHSFRIGGATEAKRLGFDDHTIMQCHRTHTKNTFVLIFK